MLRSFLIDALTDVRNLTDDEFDKFKAELMRNAATCETIDAMLYLEHYEFNKFNTGDETKLVELEKNIEYQKGMRDAYEQMSRHDGDGDWNYETARYADMAVAIASAILK